VRFTPADVDRFAGDLREVGEQISERGFDHPLSPAR
jgi:hypothetical protein